MEQEEQPEGLYDFLYRDNSRIASYYSQIFKGHLSSIEETESARQVLEKSGKVNAAVLSGYNTISKEKIDSAKRTIDPRDLITTDILSYLINNNRISQSPESALNGSLILGFGTLLFADRFMLETAVTAFEGAIQGRAKTHEGRTQQQGVKILKSILSKVIFPSAFLIRSSENTYLAGTIKDEGMEEPISTYYLRHGTAGLPEVYVIGVKEVPTYSFQLPDAQLLGVAQTAAQFLRDMVFPKDAIIVTPIALFRKL